MNRKTFNELVDGIFGVSDKIKVTSENVNQMLSKVIGHIYDEDTKYIEHLEEQVLKLKAKLHCMGESSSDLKTEFMGEHYFETEEHDMDDNEVMVKRYVPWTLQKQIFKEMCEYVKNRKDEDYRP